MLRQIFTAAFLISALLGSAARAAEPSNTIICICNYANGLMAQRKQKDAVLLLEQVFKRSPDYELCRTNLSVAYNNLAVESKEPQEALKYASRALVLCPKDKSALQNLDFAMHNANLTLTDSAAHVKYGDTLKQQGDNVGAYQQFLFALKDATANGAEIQTKVDEIIAPEEAAKWGTRGGVGAGVLFQAIQLDESKDAAFKFDYALYVRAIQRKVRTCWKAPASLGSRKVSISFMVTPGGTIEDVKVRTSCGDKLIDAQALASVKKASPFKPLPAEVFFNVPIILDLDSHADESPTYYLNGDAKPDGLRFSTGAELFPMRVPKNVDAKLQVKTDAALNQAGKLDQEVSNLEKLNGADSIALCQKLRAASVFYIQATEYKTAEDRLKRSLSIAAAAKDSSEEAASASQLGSLLYTTARNQEAEASLKKAVDIYNTSPPRDVSEQRTTLQSYAKVLYKLNRVDEANVIYAQLKTLAK